VQHIHVRPFITVREALFSTRRGVGPSLKSFPLTVHNIIAVAGRSSPNVSLSPPSLCRGHVPYAAATRARPFPAPLSRPERFARPLHGPRPTREPHGRDIFNTNMAATNKHGPRARASNAHGHRRKRRVTRWHTYLYVHVIRSSRATRKR